MPITKKSRFYGFLGLVILFCSAYTTEEKRNPGASINWALPKDSAKISSPKDTLPESRPTVSETPPAAKAKSPKRKLALIIGISLLLMAVVSALTVPALSGLFVAGNAALTGLNVVSNFGRFRGAVAGWIGIGSLDVVASLGIYRYYKKDKPKMAKITGALRLLYTGILGVGIAQLLMVSVSSPASSIYNSIHTFNKFWEIGLIAFGFHLITLGIMHEKNEGGKKWINVAIKALLITAGIGYVIQHAGMLLVANPVKFAAVAESVFIVPMILSEVAFAAWKIIKGGKAASKKPPAPGQELPDKQPSQP